MAMLIGEILLKKSIDGLTKKTHVEWKIEKYSYLVQSFDREHYHDPNLFRSPPFTFDNVSWYIKMENENLMKVGPTSATKPDCDVSFSFGIRKSDGSIETRILSTLWNCDRLMPFFRQSFLNDRELGYLHNNTLIITCDMECTLKRTAKPLKKEHMDIRGLESLSKDLKEIFINKHDCDTVIIVREKEFKAHRVVLTARSSVLAAMFRFDGVERKTGQVTIPDCDPNYFEAFLEYLYSGRVEVNSSDNAFHLFKTAEKYNVQELKSLCVNYLIQNTTVENIFEVTTFAEENNVTNLFESAQEYLKENLEEISKKAEWENFLKSNFTLATKLLTKKGLN